MSPIDLVPDMVPVLGYLDDVILVPLGIMLALRLIPPDVLASCRDEAVSRSNIRLQSNVGATIVVVLWFIALGIAGWFGFRWLA